MRFALTSRPGLWDPMWCSPFRPHTDKLYSFRGYWQYTDEIGNTTWDPAGPAWKSVRISREAIIQPFSVGLWLETSGTFSISISMPKDASLSRIPARNIAKTTLSCSKGICLCFASKPTPLKSKEIQLQTDSRRLPLRPQRVRPRSTGWMPS